ncbi:MAG: hypothetical protein EBU08_22965 [Micrococcales bacterium]|nr:hypothetical protein [Micrococcales bacterium]
MSDSTTTSASSTATSTVVKRVKRIEKALSDAPETKQPKKKAKTEKTSEVDTSLNQVTEFTNSISVITKVEDGVDIQVKRKTAHEHVLSRPDTYVGSTEFEESLVWTLVDKVTKSESADEDRYADCRAAHPQPRHAERPSTGDCQTSAGRCANSRV